jgi:hypothetical protein
MWKNYKGLFRVALETRIRCILYSGFFIGEKCTFASCPVKNRRISIAVHCRALTALSHLIVI